MVYPDSFFLGFFFLLMFFVLSVIIVVGIKSIIISIKNITKFTRRTKPIKVYKNPKTPVRKIEIDPNETTKIYVKKSS